MSRASDSLRSEERRLGRFFHRNSYCRQPDPQRQREGYLSYKKGWEARIILRDADEVELVTQLLWKVGLMPGRAFQKGKRWAVPVYGQEAVEKLKLWAAVFGTEEGC